MHCSESVFRESAKLLNLGRVLVSLVSVGVWVSLSHDEVNPVL